MFAALFTVPGGNNQETGIPILLHRKLFAGFLICDVVSLLTASTSMLLFLIILTEPYGPVGLRKILPVNLMTASFLLIISIEMMILAFVFALTIMLPKKWQVLPAITTFVVFPIPLLLNQWMRSTDVDVYRLTFRSLIS
ncbi:hypothetical protein SLA2020_261240 [Shorea laevis]